MTGERPATAALVLMTAMALGACDKAPPPPAPSSVSDGGLASASTASAPPQSVASTVLCFGAICARGELCFDASHARDAGSPYECFTVPKACAPHPTCDCLLANHEFSCPPPNRLLCSESTTGEPQVVCVMIFE